VTDSGIDRAAIAAAFALTYLGIAAGRVPGLKLDRTGIVLLGAIAVTVFGGLPTATVVGFIDWPTMLLLFGFFVLSAQLRLSGLFDALAAAIARRLDHPRRFLALLMASTAGLSAVLNHDIVCLVFTPVVATALLRQRINPVPYLVALAIASNLGSAATPVGNPQGMLISQVARLDFLHYVLWSAVPVVFALGAAFAAVWLLSKGRLASTAAPPLPHVPAHPLDRAHAAKGLVILVAAILLFLTPLPKEWVALTAAAIHLASPKFRTRDLLGEVDWPILVLFMGLFVVTGAFEAAGYGARAVAALARSGIDLGAPETLAVAAAGLSNVVNNAAAVMLLLQVVDAANAPAAYVLALASSFGGSLLLVGSVANLIVAEQARALGVEIGFRDYARLGVPSTLAALAGLLVWIGWAT
jgi:Na+/H+ antiporter NhaD/arsenite permease-like protein